MAEKHLIINADDAGSWEAADRDVLNLAEKGVVTSCSVAFNGDTCCDFLKELAGKNEQAEVGIHLNLTEGRPLTRTDRVRTLVDGRGKFPGLEKFLLNWFARRVDPREIRLEIEAQLTKAAESGRALSHVDGHHNIHLLPGISRTVLETTGRFGIKWFRPTSALIIGDKGFKAGNYKYNLFNFMTGTAARRYRACGMRATDTVVQLKSGPEHYNIDFFYETLAGIRGKTVELVCHPFSGTHQPGLPAPIIERRKAEHSLLSQMSPETLCKKTGFRLSYRSDLNT